MVSLILKREKILADLKYRNKKDFNIDFKKLEKSIIKSLTNGLF